MVMKKAFDWLAKASDVGPGPKGNILGQAMEKFGGATSKLGTAYKKGMEKIAGPDLRDTVVSPYVPGTQKVNEVPPQAIARQTADQAPQDIDSMIAKLAQQRTAEYLTGDVSPTGMGDILTNALAQAKQEKGGGLIGGIGAGLGSLNQFLQSSAGQGIMAGTAGSPEAAMTYVKRGEEAKAGEAASMRAQQEALQKVYETNVAAARAKQKEDLDRAVQYAEIQAENQRKQADIAQTISGYAKAGGLFGMGSKKLTPEQQSQLYSYRAQIGMKSPGKEPGFKRKKR